MILFHSSIELLIIYFNCFIIIFKLFNNIIISYITIQCDNQEDLNARVGHKTENMQCTIGKFGENFNLKIRNTLFEYKNRHKYTKKQKKK